MIVSYWGCFGYEGFFVMEGSFVIFLDFYFMVIVFVFILSWDEFVRGSLAGCYDEILRRAWLRVGFYKMIAGTTMTVM